jgi:hypothetical protein
MTMAALRRGLLGPDRLGPDGFLLGVVVLGVVFVMCRLTLPGVSLATVRTAFLGVKTGGVMETSFSPARPASPRRRPRGVS